MKISNGNITSDGSVVEWQTDDDDGIYSTVIIVANCLS